MNSVLHDITGSAQREEVFLDGRKDKFPQWHQEKPGGICGKAVVTSM